MKQPLVGEQKRQRKRHRGGRAERRIMIMGNPNVGKTALFNRLTGGHYKVGNYPGVTVERRSGILKGSGIYLEDLPGAYGLQARSLDEEVVSKIITSWKQPANRPDLLLYVADATNLGKSLFFLLQLRELDIPIIVALNMMDEARRKQIEIDSEKLLKMTGVAEVLKVSAKTGEGFAELRNTLIYGEFENAQSTREFEFPPEIRERIASLVEILSFHRTALPYAPEITALKLLDGYLSLEELASRVDREHLNQIAGIVQNIHSQLNAEKINLSELESDYRYQLADRILDEVWTDKPLQEKSWSERVDSLITHPVGGIAILLLLLSFVFNAVFTWAEYPMGWIEAGVEWLALTAQNVIPAGVFQELLVEGVIAGVGNVVVFLPQIVILIFFLSLLEDSGYMSRMAFLLEKSMQRIGLSGKSVLPLLSGFACAIPAIMAARTIENWRQRLLTIMVIPLMSCSARLPVYTLLIAAFVPNTKLGGWLSLQGLVLLGAYIAGFLMAVLVAVLVSRFKKKQQNSHFIMEMPPYRIPILKSVFWRVYDSAKLFLVNAGSIILALSVIMWFLAAYPKVDPAQTPEVSQVEQSYAGQFGKILEPVIAPLGFDWKIGVGLIASFTAREVMVSTMATLYQVEADDDNPVSLVEALQSDKKVDGSPRYSSLTGISLLVFFIFAAQCMSTFAIIRRETNSWKWPVVMVLYLNGLAYLASLLVYQIGSVWGA
ncbi:MAG: ferrous iron transport protein B [Calditrichia bacterium]